MTQHLLCVGMGYSARVLSRRLASAGWRVTGSATGPDGMARIMAAGWNAIAFDGTAASVALGTAIRTATHLVVSAAPGEAGDPLLRCHAGDIAAAPDLAWIGYLSTIGVYGDHQGRWVDDRAASASRSSAWPASTAPGAAPSTTCARELRGASSSRARSSTASTSRTSPARSKPPSASRTRGTRSITSPTMNLPHRRMWSHMQPHC